MSRGGARAQALAIGSAIVASVLLPVCPAAAADPGGVQAAVMVQVSADEGTLAVAQAFTLAGPGTGSWTMPLLLPESGPLPRMVEKLGDAPGLQVRARGGATAKVRDGLVVLSGTPGTSGDFGAEVQYQVPVSDARVVLAATPLLDIAQAQVIHRGGPYALQVRPLAPFAYREVAEADGTWRYQALAEPVSAGRPIRVAVGRLPTGTGPYRDAGLAVLLAVAAGTVLVLVRRRAG